MKKPTIILSPRKAAVSAQGGYLDIVVRVQAPDRVEEIKQAHISKRLALVVDRSGSMSGQPLAEALRCVMHIANHLTPQDEMSLVVYDDKADVLVPLRKVTSVTEIQRAVDHVTEGGSTDLFAGWETGAKQLEGGADGAISRVILLSDGQANRGETDIATIEDHCKRWLQKGVSTTTVGLGRGFNEDLMNAIARAGGGQQYYGQTAEDLYDSFEEELSLLQAMYLRKISLKFSPAAGVIVEVLSNAVQNPDGSYRLNDLAWESEAWMGVRLHISPSAAGSTRDLLAMTLSGTDMDGNTLEQTAPMLQLPVIEAALWNAMAADELADRRLLELEFAKASEELRKMAREGDREATRRKMAEMDARFSEHPWLKAKMEVLHRLAEEDMEMMMKEAHFSASRSMQRLVARSEMLFCKDETESVEMPSFLRKKVSEGRGRRTQK